ncbi:DsbA family oxidoreductase [Deinococcus cellulosilyticus]|uniref:DSBA-like thioredoxin domain-containing protein n=1 Tax=Deinococcus cellulosilyticus (strain DSM 18568 / NBRC 106333 / KACC 11606 / 5516J-15) TaxID=1223518 RepID=A0A511N7T7_DEIC1|nr:DsbA family protein [Deinococcus cellulosilyticus]GEM48903.1 hypothetical protein DC3_45380 [Deinococcus cellulosilyticus NBRC 106333 = KACC 11606]
MITVFFDFSCPFAWRGLELAEVLRQHEGFEFELLHFSLEQHNHPENAANRFEPTWFAHQQPTEESKTLLSLLGSLAAKQQGAECHRAFVLELFRAHHQDRLSLRDPETLKTAAQRANLDLPRFEYDLHENRDALREELKEDLSDACRLKVFGTPTFVLESGDAAYFRFRELPETPETARALWDLYTQVLASEARIETVKKPR